MKGSVVAVCKSPTHSLSKPVHKQISIIAGYGVDGDAHAGEKVQHLSRIKKNPITPNLRQVHLMHSELFAKLKTKGFEVSSGIMGENITTIGIDLLNLPKGTILKIGQSAEIELTGLRNPCHQLDSIQQGLMAALVYKDENGNIIRECGIMGIVIQSGEISTNDTIIIQYPKKPFIALEAV